MSLGVDYMKIDTGYLYHIKDDFFDKINDNGLIINHENGHARPTYFTIRDKDILWFIPLSSKIEKYESIIDNGVPIRVADNLRDEILDNFNSLLALKKQGVNLFFADIDKIKEIMLDELK